CYDPPLKEVNNVEFSSILERAFKEQGLSYERVGAAFGTDASNLAIVGVGTVVLGPGDIRFAHTNDERVDLEEVERGVSLYLEILKQWMMGEG
ncbi:MAG: M20/M25/M40 family metallo-hydrolase, partial [Chthoniobacterales bacterium]|nr:M20/M25/M40 family metallo-hydrolase [Chthoniobacterales bacterium]